MQVPLEQIAGSGGRGRVTRRDVEAFQKRQDGAPPAPDGADARGIRALPNVRRAARERGIDLSAVLAFGFPNPITLAALDAYLAQTAAAPVEAATQSAVEGARRIPLSRLRQTIGRRLSESMREAPHFYVTGEFIFDRALERLAGGARINDLILYLTAQTLLRVPALNATFQDGALYQHDGVHLALAVARDDGLITPVLRDAGRYSLTGLAAETRALVERARANRLSVDDLQGGTFTVSNMGMVAQVEHFTAVINPPQVGILAVGALKPRPVAIDGGLFVRQTAHLTLSGDHRAVDGMDLARFMAYFQEELDRFSA
jgi:pyruvate dehydrogenase E2 component (dihydrolipoamide acetyltransferase)